MPSSKAQLLINKYVQNNRTRIFSFTINEYQKQVQDIPQTFHRHQFLKGEKKQRKKKKYKYTDSLYFIFLQYPNIQPFQLSIQQVIHNFLIINAKYFIYKYINASNTSQRQAQAKSTRQKIQRSRLRCQYWRQYLVYQPRKNRQQILYPKMADFYPQTNCTQSHSKHNVDSQYNYTISNNLEFHDM
eukprot:TRINITY_DN11242_c2_g1_i2.p2 TRINITY_DN11242_c2_g1~~TRINITY_DN11242_c2_g1_i2.p2  ORF type:complete len:203 (-),score=-16.74 TRINITY_DN11242_c2_g1_i2:235-792(-)